MSNESSETEQTRLDIMRRFADTHFLTAAIGKATLDAVRKHKRAGNPIATWHNGSVVIIQPEDIVLQEDHHK